MQPDDRKLKILKAIIDDYIMSAVPVGSRTISRKSEIGLSSATVRNEMSDLEEMGYLEQPHTSAGRVPSDKAYRLYVDKLLNVMPLTSQEVSNMRKFFARRVEGVEQVLGEVAHVLSDLTQYTSVVLAPQIRKQRMKHVQLVPVDADKVLLVAVTDSGIYKDALIRLNSPLAYEDFERISRLLTQRFSGRTQEELTTYVREGFSEEMKRYRSLLDAVMQTMENKIAHSQSRDVVLGGTQHLFEYPEFNDIEKARRFLSFIDTKDALYSMLSRATDWEISITIGSENEYDEMQETSMVTATYSIGDKKLGSFGIIGPTRMQYAKVISVLEHMGKSLSAVLTDMAGGTEMKND